MQVQPILKSLTIGGRVRDTFKVLFKSVLREVSPNVFIYTCTNTLMKIKIDI